MSDASGFRSTALMTLAGALCVCLLPLSAAHAQAVTPAAASPQAAASVPLVPIFAPDSELLAAFGGKDGIFKLADVFVDRMSEDKVIGHYFQKPTMKMKPSLLKSQLGDQLCQVLAGPCVYDGDTMKSSHADLGITKADSLRQVEVLQDSMAQLGIPFSAQNQLLARLAPMYRDIIKR